MEDGEGVIVFVDKGLYCIVVRVGTQRQHPQARIGVLAMEGFDMGQFLFAGAAPGRSEVDQYHLSLLVGEADLGVV